MGHLFLTTILLCCLLPVSSMAPPADCNKCTSLPPDCQISHDDSFLGGAPCACTNINQPNGCVLKPCDFVETDDICDCTLSTGSFESVGHSHRLHCRKYQCAGNSGECETCKELPPDCTQASYANPPSAGGAECACEASMTPGGCTLKTCGTGSHAPEDPCVPRNGVSENATFIWYRTTCPPGKWNSTAARNTDHRDLVAGWGLLCAGVLLMVLAIVACVMMSLRGPGRLGPQTRVGMIPRQDTTVGVLTIIGCCTFVVANMFLVKGFWILYNH